MQKNAKKSAPLPKIMSKEQFRTYCHISKHTAYYLIHSGIIPCKIKGNRTKRYFIKRDDVLAFLEQKEENPFLCTPPEGWYKKSGRPLIKESMRVYPPQLPEEKRRRSYYTRKLKSRKDVFDVGDITNITGYNCKTVQRWLREGKIEYIMNIQKYYVPKVHLIDFLAGDEYMAIHKKSKTHLHDLWEMYNTAGKINEAETAYGKE